MRIFLPKNRASKKVNGLMDSAQPGECRVYRAKKDGTKGRLIKIVKNSHPSNTWNPDFQRRYNYKNGGSNGE